MDDVAQQLLMAHLTGGTSMADIVAQVASDDPTAAQLLSALRQREAASDDDPHDEDDVQLEFDAQTADVLERLYAEVECLRARNRELAAALGACPRCFGGDDVCPVCAGRGRPGGRRPDPGLFTELVMPAVERAGAALPMSAFSDRA